MEAETLGYLFGIGIVIAIVFAIAEFWGRTKHIGRLWSILLLLFGGIILGIIPIAVSPDVRKQHTKGHNGHIAFGIVSLILSLIMVFSGIGLMASGQGKYNREEFEGGKKLIFLGIYFLFLGIYLIKLFKGEIINHNPRISHNNYQNNGWNFHQNQNAQYQQPNHYNNQTYNNTPPVNTPTQSNNGGSFYNGGHNATANNQPQQKVQTPQQPPQRKPQGGKGQFNGNLYN